MRAARGSPRRRWARSALAASALLLVGWVAGRATAPDVPAPRSATASLPRSGSRLGASSLHSASGAARAVAADERSFASAAILAPGALRKRIEAVATPGYVAMMLAANSPGTERLARGAIGIGLESGTQTIFQAVPIGYRVESYTPSRARVLTWGSQRRQPPRRRCGSGSSDLGGSIFRRKI